MHKGNVVALRMRGATALVLTLACGAAQADTISVSNFFSGPTDQTSLPILVDQFDPTLGTLNSVTITLSAVMDTSLSATNDGNFFVGWEKNIYQLALDGSSVFASAQIAASAPQVIVGSFTNITCPSPTVGACSAITGGYEWSLEGPELSASQSFTDSSPGAGYLGTGTLAFYLTTQNQDTYSVAGTQTGGVPPSQQQLRTNILAEVTVTYDYTPVPLPAAAWLLLSGLGVLGANSRRRVA